MTGLVYKDLMVMKKTLLIYVIIGAFYGYLDISNGRTGMMFAMLLITSTMVPISAIAYDERCKWDKLVNTAPVSRKEVIAAKYLLALVLTAISAVMVFIVYLFKPGMTISENLATVAVMSLMAMVYQAFLLPTIIKFGSEKGRMIMMIILFAPIVLIGVLAKREIINLSVLSDFLEANSHLLPYITVAAVAVIYLISIMVSVKIYESKDL